MRPAFQAARRAFLRCRNRELAVECGDVPAAQKVVPPPTPNHWCLLPSMCRSTPEVAVEAQDVPCAIDPARAANGADYPEGALTDAVARDAGSGAIVSQTRYTLIDAQGRVTASVQRTAGLADMAFTYSYGTAGQLATVGYPSGRVVSYDLNGANRVKHVRNGASYYLQSAGYKPNGSYTGAALGATGVGEIREYNSRFQSCGVEVQKAGVAVPRLALQWKYSTSDTDGVCEGTGSDNDGNLRGERLQFLNGGYANRSYSYDAGNRITSYSEPSASQSFGYDAFGNLWQTGTAAGRSVASRDGVGVV